MPTITIDGQTYEVREGLSVLQAALELGFNLPYFCWHPAMGSVGACRQCAVKQFRDANDTRGRIVMACMTPAVNNALLSISAPDVVEFRKSITEWLMVNHPHDCPICDEGGECHLQDMTIMTGHNYRRYDGKKRTFYNQDLGPLVNQEMNRCIQCYRCVRFYRDYAGGHDFDAFALHDAVFFGRGKDGVLESEFSGNLVEVCPTGVFTDKTLKKHFTRKWDLQTAPSVCVNCSVGCNTTPGERYGMLRRIRNRYNGDVNGYFLCDRGRYGYEFVNSTNRIREPRVASVTTTPQEAAKKISELLEGGKPVLGIGSPRASLESNFALRSLVGPDNFSTGFSAREGALVRQVVSILKSGPARSPSLQDIARSDAVLVLGEDVSNTAPMIALALRQSVRQQPIKKYSKAMKIPVWDDYPLREAIQHEKGPLFIAALASTRIDDIAAGVYRGAPQDIAQLGFAVAHELDANAPIVEDLADDLRAMAQSIATALRAADQPLVISGTSLGSTEIIQAAANVAWSLAGLGKAAQLSYALAENNTMGLGLMGGKDLDEIMREVETGQVETLIVLENDLSRRMAPDQMNAMLRGARNVVVLDTLENATTAQAQIVFPAATFAEGSGSMVNNEGRVQRFYQVFVPQGQVQESWQWIKAIMASTGNASDARWITLDELQAAMATELDVFKPLLDVAPPANFRIAGAKIPRMTARFSGRTAIFANQTIHEPAPPPDPDTPLAFTMEGSTLQPPPSLIPNFWAPGWNSIQSLNKFQQEIGGPLMGGNPGARLIEPLGGMAVPTIPEVISGKPFLAVPMTTGPGVENGKTQTPADGNTMPPAQTPEAPGRPDYFTQIPRAYSLQHGEWLVVPMYYVFGSEELSVLSPGIAELSPEPYIAINGEDAREFITSPQTTSPSEARQENSFENMVVELSVQGTTYHLPVRILKELPRGIAGIPMGLAGLDVIGLPATGGLTPVDK